MARDTFPRPFKEYHVTVVHPDGAVEQPEVTGIDFDDVGELVHHAWNILGAEGAKLRVTEIILSEGTARDVTEDILERLAEDALDPAEQEALDAATHADFVNDARKEDAG